MGGAIVAAPVLGVATVVGGVVAGTATAVGTVAYGCVSTATGVCGVVPVTRDQIIEPANVIAPPAVSVAGAFSNGISNVSGNIATMHPLEYTRLLDPAFYVSGDDPPPAAEEAPAAEADKDDSGKVEAAPVMVFSGGRSYPDTFSPYGYSPRYPNSLPLVEERPYSYSTRTYDTRYDTFA